MTSRTPIVILLMRKESIGYYSIERLFGTLTPFLSKSFEIRVVRLPCDSRGVLRCVRNLFFTARLKADLIHVTGDIYYCALAVPRRRCVLTFHDLCSIARLNGVRKKVFSLLWYRMPLRWAPYVTAISEETKEQLKLNFPKSAGKVQLVPNCVDEAFGRIRPYARADYARLQVLQVGTSANKNLERVAASASGLPLHLRIIGPLSSDQLALLCSLDISWSSVEDLSADELIAEYRNSDTLVFASTYEGFGLPIVEAQASGLPVITSNVPPMTHTAGHGALLVDPYDEREIHAALEQLLYSPELARRLSDQGKRNAKRFDARSVADQYSEIYRRTLGRQCGRRLLEVTLARRSDRRPRRR